MYTRGNAIIICLLLLATGLSAQITTNTNFLPNISEPLDIRQKIATLADTTTLAFTYDGAITYVTDEDLVYYRSTTGWIPLGVTTIDSLYDANQMKWLYTGDTIAEIIIPTSLDNSTSNELDTVYINNVQLVNGDSITLTDYRLIDVKLNSSAGSGFVDFYVKDDITGDTVILSKKANYDWYIEEFGDNTFRLIQDGQSEGYMLTSEDSTIIFERGQGFDWIGSLRVNPYRLDSLAATIDYIDDIGLDTSGTYHISIDNDLSPTNEIELPVGGNFGDVLKTDGAGNYSWMTPSTFTDTDDQTLSLSGTDLSISDGNTIDISSINTDTSGTYHISIDNDLSPTNELDSIYNANTSEWLSNGDTIAVINSGTTYTAEQMQDSIGTLFQSYNGLVYDDATDRTLIDIDATPLITSLNSNDHFLLENAFAGVTQHINYDNFKNLIIAGLDPSSTNELDSIYNANTSEWLSNGDTIAIINTQWEPYTVPGVGWNTLKSKIDTVFVSDGNNTALLYADNVYTNSIIDYLGNPGNEDDILTVTPTGEIVWDNQINAFPHMHAFNITAIDYSSLAGISWNDEQVDLFSSAANQQVGSSIIEAENWNSVGNCECISLVNGTYSIDAVAYIRPNSSSGGRWQLHIGPTATTTLSGIDNGSQTVGNLQYGELQTTGVFEITDSPNQRLKIYIDKEGINKELVGLNISVNIKRLK